MVSRLNCRRGASYVDYPDWIKKKKVTINTKNKDDKCFQYAVTVALNYDKIGSHLERVSNIKQSINKCISKGINYPSEIDEWKTLKKNNPTIAADTLYTQKNKRNKYSVYLKN